MGLVGGLLGVSIVIFLWGFEAFGASYEGTSYKGNLAQFVITGLVAGILPISSILVPMRKPLLIGLLLLIGAIIGFIALNIVWIVPGLIMLVGTYYAAKAISQPESLIVPQPSNNLRYAIVCIILVLLFGLLFLGVSFLMGPRVGFVFSTPTAVPIPTLKR